MTGMPLLTDRAATHRVSRAEFEDFRTGRDDGSRYELLDGEILVTPSPVTVHQRVITRLLVLLSPTVPTGYELLPAPYDVHLDVGEGDTVLQPDLLVARSSDLTQTHLPAPPLLVVEVLSPTTWHRDLGEKMAAYAASGVEHYWVVAPQAPSLTVHRLGADGRYAEVAHVEGDEVARIEEPVSLDVSAGALVV